MSSTFLNIPNLGNVVAPLNGASVGNIPIFSSGDGQHLADSELSITSTSSTITVQPTVDKTIEIHGASPDGGVSIRGNNNSSGSGGAINITAGSSNSAGIGSAVNITSGANSGAGGGGTLTFSGGASSTSGNGGTLVFKGGRSTGGGSSGSVTLRTGNSASGSIRLNIDPNGNVVIGNSSISTNATDGFFYINSSQGKPTGVPTDYSGRMPLHYDSANNVLYSFNGGWNAVVNEVTKEIDFGSSGSASVVSFTDSEAAFITITSNTVLTTSGMIAGGRYILRTKQDGSGGHTVSLNDVLWPNSIVPTFSSSANAIDLVNIYFDGNNIYGNINQNYTATSSWNPADKGGLIVWFRADNVNTDEDGRVITLLDKSGNDYNAIPPDGNTPLVVNNVINNKPVVRFTASNSEQLNFAGTTALLNKNSQNTVVIVTKASAQLTAGNTAVFLSVGSGVNLYTAFFNSEDSNYGQLSAGGGSTGTDNSVGLDSFNYYSSFFAFISQYNGGGGFGVAANYDWLINNVTHNPTSQPGTVSTNVTESSIGAFGPSNLFYDGDIAEIIIWNSNLSGGEVTSLHNYLNSRYGVG